jgi:acyl dehydratase
MLGTTDKSKKGRYFEDFEVGEEFVTLGKTITEADVVLFAAFSGDHDPLHTDKEFCRQKNPHGEIIAHDILGIVTQAMLSHDLGITEGTTMLAFLGMTWKFLKPIRIGDTLHVKQIVVDKKETSKRGRGVVTIQAQLMNQLNEIIQEGTKSILFARRR